jgi:hypothetical protein
MSCSRYNDLVKAADMKADSELSAKGTWRDLYFAALFIFVNANCGIQAVITLKKARSNWCNARSRSVAEYTPMPAPPDLARGQAAEAGSGVRWRSG